MAPADVAPASKTQLDVKETVMALHVKKWVYLDELKHNYHHASGGRQTDLEYGSTGRKTHATGMAIITVGSAAWPAEVAQMWTLLLMPWTPHMVLCQL
jgi:hypothetical protein